MEKGGSIDWKKELREALRNEFPTLEAAQEAWAARKHRGINGVNGCLVAAAWNYKDPMEEALVHNDFSFGVRALCDYYKIVVPQ